MYNQDPGELTCFPFPGKRKCGMVRSDMSPLYLKL